MPTPEDWLDLLAITVIFFIGIVVTGIVSGLLFGEGMPPAMFYVCGLAVSGASGILTFILNY